MFTHLTKYIVYIFDKYLRQIQLWINCNSCDLNLLNTLLGTLIGEVRQLYMQYNGNCFSISDGLCYCCFYLPTTRRTCRTSCCMRANQVVTDCPTGPGQPTQAGIHADIGHAPSPRYHEPVVPFALAALWNVAVSLSCSYQFGPRLGG